MWIKLRLKGSPVVVRLHVISAGKYLRVSGPKSKEAFANVMSHVLDHTDWASGGEEMASQVFQTKMKNPDMRVANLRRDGSVTVSLLGESGATFSSADCCVIEE